MVFNSGCQALVWSDGYSRWSHQKFLGATTPLRLETVPKARLLETLCLAVQDEDNDVGACFIGYFLGKDMISGDIWGLELQIWGLCYMDSWNLRSLQKSQKQKRQKQKQQKLWQKLRQKLWQLQLRNSRKWRQGMDQIAFSKMTLASNGQKTPWVWRHTHLQKLAIHATWRLHAITLFLTSEIPSWHRSGSSYTRASGPGLTSCEGVLFETASRWMAQDVNFASWLFPFRLSNFWVFQHMVS